jgi:hypothetical protein
MEREDKIVFGVIFAALLTVFSIVGWAVSAELSRYNRLMVECRADGVPEYECHSMLRIVRY